MAVLSAVVAMAMGAIATLAYAYEAYRVLMVVGVAVLVYLVYLYVRYRMRYFYRFVVWACLELLSLFLLVPSLHAAGKIGDKNAFVIAVESMGSVAFLGLCGLCAVGMVMSAKVDCTQAKRAHARGTRGTPGGNPYEATGRGDTRWIIIAWKPTIIYSEQSKSSAKIVGGASKDKSVERKEGKA